MRCVLGEPRDGITIEAEVTNLRFANDTTRTGVVHKQGRVAGLAETCQKTLKRQMPWWWVKAGEGKEDFILDGNWRGNRRSG